MSLQERTNKVLEQLQDKEGLEKLKRQMQGKGLRPPEGIEQEDYDFLMSLRRELGGVRRQRRKVMEHTPKYDHIKYFNKERILKKKELEKILDLSIKYKMPLKEDGETVSLHYIEKSYPCAVSDSRDLLEIHRKQIQDKYLHYFFSFVMGSNNKELLEFYGFS